MLVSHWLWLLSLGAWSVFVILVRVRSKCTVWFRKFLFCLAILQVFWFFGLSVLSLVLLCHIPAHPPFLAFLTLERFGFSLRCIVSKNLGSGLAHKNYFCIKANIRIGDYSFQVLIYNRIVSMLVAFSLSFFTFVKGCW